MNTIEFTIPGPVLVQKRHRDRKYGGKYDPSKDDKQLIRNAYFEHTNYKLETPPKTTPFQLEIIAYFKRPKTHLKKGELRHTAPDPHEIVKIPDLDNILKIIMDALSHAVWHNDSQVQKATIEKRWADATPRTEITISWKEELI